MRKIWNKMDKTTKAGMAVFALYLFLYVFLDIMEEILGVAL